MRIAEAARGMGPVLLGVIRRSPPGERPLTIWNSLQVVEADGTISATYDKGHLVPFGEFLPFRAWLSPLGLDAIAASGLDFSRGANMGALALGGLPPARVLICYEAIFPREVLSGNESDRGPFPAWLLNITNDAWFGEQTGPYQHLAEARMRAIENGLPVVRVANTGISAVIDPMGREISRLDLGVKNYIDTDLPKPLHNAATRSYTIYGRFGEFGTILMISISVFFAFFVRKFVK
jgi:apolipoprotein N-acyltransferase